MNLYQAYLNWRLEGVRSALAKTDRRFYEGSEGMKKAIPRADECVISQGNSDTLRYLRGIGELKAKESKLVAKLLG